MQKAQIVNNPITFETEFSKVIALLRFPMAFAIVMFHFVPVTTQVDFPVYNFLHFVVWFICSGHIVVPLFFIFSGYLFFNKQVFNRRIYVSKLKKRFYSLFIPYVFWNLALILLHLAFQQFLPQYAHGEGGWIKDYTLKEWLACFYRMDLIKPTLSPEPYDNPLWFIRDLMITVLLSPILYYGVKKLKWILPFILSVVYVIILIHTNLELYYLRFSSITFFTIGIWISLNKNGIEFDFVRKVCPYYCITYAIIMLTIYTMGGAIYSSVIFRSVNIIPAVAFLLGVGFMVINWKPQIIFPEFYNQSVFVIYAGHAFFLSTYTKLLGSMGLYNDDIMLSIVYVLTPLLMTTMWSVITLFVKNHLPKLYPIMTGGR